jgi:hypothetical protein
MPVDLQEKILGSILGPDLAALWRQLLCDRVFHTPIGSVSYAVGQPMGFLTSWATMAITHHAIINFAKKDKSFYGIIGDDIVIASKRGAEDYKNILDRLGMEISLEKSVLSTEQHKLGEIAKRLFIDGFEISPIPPDILIKSTGTIIGFLEFIRVFSEKFHSSDQCGFFDSEYPSILNRLFSISQFKEDEDARILLSCPILEYFPILPTIPPLDEVRSSWKADPNKKKLIMDFEQFLLELYNNRTNEKVIKMMDPKFFVESELKEVYPIYEEFKDQVKKALKLLSNRINTTYVDDEADSFAEGPMKDLRDLLSYPNPEKSGIYNTYLSKRELRLRNTHSVIQLFLSTPRFKARYGITEAQTKP